MEAFGLSPFLVPSLTTLEGLAPFSVEGGVTSHKRKDGGNERAAPASAAATSDDEQAQKKPRQKPGRKLDTSQPTDKRVAQSREAQRAFRERKANHVKELEARVAELTRIVEQKGPSKNELELAEKVQSLQAENAMLRQITFAFDFSHPISASSLTLNNGLPFGGSVGLASSLNSGTGGNLDFLTGLMPSPPSMASSVSNPSPSLNLEDDAFAALFMQTITPPPSSGSPATLLLPTTSASNIAQHPPHPPTISSVTIPSPNINFTAFRDTIPQVNGLNDDEPDFLESLLAANNSPSNGSNNSNNSSNTSPTSTTAASVPSTSNTCDDASCEGFDKETCEDIAKSGMPHLRDAYKALKAIPSLQKEDALIDELCDVFITVSTKCTEETMLTGVCPAENPVSGSIYEDMKRVHAKVLSKCDGDDGVAFTNLIKDVREKHQAHLEKTVFAGLVGKK
ncbi:hypothetical protein BDR26DRAFT_634109 [Obelidium mucronatum]|nr:hypothetical protein BDR26DRAFT_634109 [Obelidium mucronatum]